MEFIERIATGLHGRFKLAEFFGLEVADLLGIPPVEVELFGVETKSLHF